MSERSKRRVLGRSVAAAAGVVLAALMPQLEPQTLAGGGTSDRGRSLEQEADAAVQARLICDATSLVPGRKTRIAVAFDLAPGWHLYWRNPGDSGLPISFKIRSPGEVSIGRVYWPTPSRHVAPGGVLDYIYEKQATLVFDAQTSFEATPGHSVTIEADLSWLVCREACVPGERTVKLTLPIAFEAGASRESQRFADASARIPRPFTADRSAPLSAAWKGRELVIDAPQADEMLFFPFESEQAVPTNLIERGEVRGRSLSIPYADGVSTADKVRAVVEVRANGRSSFHELEIAPPP